GHEVEGFSEDAELVAAFDADAVREIASLDELCGAIEFVDGLGDLAGEREAGDQGGSPNDEKGDEDKDEKDEVGIAQLAEGAEHAAAQLRVAGVEYGEHRVNRLDFAVRANVEGVEAGNDVDGGIDPQQRGLQRAILSHDTMRGGVFFSAAVGGVQHALLCA